MRLLNEVELLFGLLTKRLARSLWRTKIRLFAVVIMVMVGVFAGISFAAYAHTASSMYEDIYADTDKGVNLADIWVENPSSTWNGSVADSICDEIEYQWPDSDLSLNECEPRLKLDGVMFHISDDGEEAIVPAVWHGIDQGHVDRVWFPDHECCSGVMPSADDEIVVDVRVAEGMDVGIGDSITIGAGSGSMNYSVVGIGHHSNHLYYAQSGSLFPADPGTFATGYLTAEGLEKLANLSDGSANLLLIDIVGTPDYDLQSTIDIEGEEITVVIGKIDSILQDIHDSPSLVYSRSGVESVEYLRADAESAMEIYVPVTAMIAIVAGITIFLSLQRLVQSQSREIAILRTLGIPRNVIIPGYILMPIIIGLVGCLFGVIFGVLFGAPSMLDMYEGVLGIPILESADINPILLQISGIAMLVVLFSGILPAIQASRLQPLEIMRGQHQIRLSSRMLQKLTSRLPSTVGLTIRSSIRKPARLAFTFFAVGLSMLIFGSMTLMMGTMEDAIVGNVEDNQNWDAEVVVPFGGEVAVSEWAEEQGANYEWKLAFPANPEGDTRYLSANGLDSISTNDNSMIVLDLKEGSLPVANSETIQVLVDEGLQHFLDWQVGQTQTIMFGATPMNIEITGITQGEISRTVYLHRQDLVPVVGIEATSVLIELPQGAEVDSELGEISLGVTQKEDLISTFENLLEQQQGIFSSVLALGIIIAIVVLFNTLIMNLAERDVEIATLRVLGAPINKIGGMMLGEHIAIGLIGGILATGFTIIGTQALVSTFIQWAFYLTVSPDFMVIAQLIGIVVFISVMLTPFGMWRISRLDLVEKVKDLSQ
ncbi:MAG TPA: FtsX-like permease family protein [Candidatus Poseidoniales archaeon]|nr:MAG TPA: FtsX-like permease family protein [Candidatus Poseidoniales archaeon]